MNEALVRLVDEHIESAASRGELDRVIRELATFGRLVAGSSRLAGVLASGDVSLDEKRSLVLDISKSSFDEATLGLVVDVASSGHEAETDLAGLLVEVTANAVFAAAKHDGSLDAVEGGLVGFAKLVAGNAALRSALTDAGVASAPKVALIREIAGAAVGHLVIELLSLLVAIDHGRDIDGRAEALADLAATRRGQTVAHISVAVSLDDDRRNKLVQAVEQMIGASVRARFSVDPSIGGSVVVRINDEVLDGSLAQRFAQARKTMVSAS